MDSEDSIAIYWGLYWMGWTMPWWDEEDKRWVAKS
jgi:hypothetical protein